MSVLEDKDRKVVPRWRALRATLHRHELDPLSARATPPPDARAEFAAKLEEWRQNRSFSFAADLLASSVVLGRQSEANDAAEFVLGEGGTAATAARALASRVLGVSDESSPPLDLYDMSSRENLARCIRDLRRQLRFEARNVFLWVDLARAYESLGASEKARAAMRPALALAPTNRHVLRCASRLYVHHDDFRRAHDILRGSPTVRRDPWILSAEIAVGSSAGRVSKFVKTARRMLDARRFAPLYLSELASALGTLELEAGNARRGRRLVRQSLERPSENAVAQAAWVGRKYGGITLPEALLRGSSCWEAAAWTEFFAGQWRDAIEGAKEWLGDEPFSVRPACLGSYIACVCLGEFDEGADIAGRGLQANPNHFLLQNNQAFSLAKADRLEEASTVFGRINQRSLTREDHIVWLATSGLLLYRSGHPQKGRLRYSEAIEAANRGSDIARQTLARTFLALEEGRIHSPHAEADKREAMARLRNMSRADFRPLEQALDRMPVD